MSWASVEAKIVWYDGTQYLNGTYTGAFTISNTPFDGATQDAIKAALADLYANSATARAYLDEAAGKGDILFAVASSAAQTGFAQVVDNLVAFNWSNLQSLYVINDHGTLVHDMTALSLIHEIIHLHGSGLSDHTGQSESQMNAASSDQVGQVLPIQNAVADEMGWSDNIQASYASGLLSADNRFGDVVANSSYTDDHQVDLVRLGFSAADDLNHSARTTLLNDLMFGFNGDDTIHTGAGDDYAYGGAGADEIHGGDGADVLFGEADNDTLYGDDGDDFLDAGAGTSQSIDGGDGSDTASFQSLSSGLTIDATAGALTLSSSGTNITNVESVFATDLADTFTLHGYNGLIAGLGGDDTITVGELEDDGPQAIFLAPGADADTVAFSEHDNGNPLTFIMGADANDVATYGGVNIADFQGSAEHHETTGDSENGMEMWYNFDDGPVNNFTQELLVAWSSDMPGVFAVSYVNLDWSNYPSGPDVTGATFYVAGFQPGNFGIDATSVPGFTAADARATMELIASTFGGDDAGAALAIDHVWNLLGVEDYTPSPLRTPQGESMSTAQGGSIHPESIVDGIDLGAFFGAQEPLVYLAQGQESVAPSEETSDPTPLEADAAFVAFTNSLLHPPEMHSSDFWFA